MSAAKLNQREQCFDVIVVGSGIAGLFAAYKASKFGRVCLVTKAKLQDTNTWLAQGGIAAALGEDDNPSLHLTDTLSAGAGACDPEAVALLVDEGPQRVRELMALGVPFDCENGRIALTREGAHQRNRVLHCGGDATGRLIQQALQRAVLANKTVDVYENLFVTDLLNHNGLICGVQTITGQVLFAGAVILATGGLGQVFSRTTNPAVATGDGVAMAYRAGADVADMEYIQFHPTVFQGQSEQQTFLVSEAVRGEGAVLRNSQGEAFMARYHPLAELGPRDVVARAIADQIRKQDGKPVLLDITHKTPAYLRGRFPTIYQKARRLGVNMATDYLPVSPAAHYAMGGVVIGLNGQTNLPGLYACGEVACSGVHGANRLASNSLLEGLVFAGSAVKDIELKGGRIQNPVARNPKAFTPLAAKSGMHSFRQLRSRMFEEAGLLRQGSGMECLLAELTRLEQAWPDASTQQALEWRNCVTVAKLIVIGALKRRESRGGHYRLDFPSPNPAFAQVKLIQNIKEATADASIAI